MRHKYHAILIFTYSLPCQLDLPLSMLVLVQASDIKDMYEGERRRQVKGNKLSVNYLQHHAITGVTDL